MVYAGVMAITDPACLESSEEPGCNLFGVPDCRACALMPEAVSADSPPCELLVVFNQESAAVAGEDCGECEPEVPPPLSPADAAQPVGTTGSDESSAQEDYVPIVIVLPTDVFIEVESSVWTDSGSSSGFDDDSDAGGEQDTSNVGRRLRTQL
ncbi:hypothetical protein PF005_g30926 [Phytophthora fragariae]|uniref:Uncharacterized protein n=1 Tax=Phytophthora fragariae TaxID=53985 RepID=A0A6A3TI45_9STRA|nr:hypothetical protein PF003_g27541 [Phytophthora fragariae]KAE8932161.1 hypothetical protein PF009_g17799 [Phytophthora fragariae]KAE8976371.1 hypothetical protein PF011_g24078 [Phytophthora fragariae]KAE9072990.1 hypothetical protein PF007_g25978 [Phytophthora fragariae]KAE9073820.1 hypothetical protein PF010_g24920 [Phytophthora fragariae]